MPSSWARFTGLRDAATALAFARRQDMDSAEEWDDLERAILIAEEVTPNETSPLYEFRGDRLYRLSTLASGATEDHVCTPEDLEQVAYAIEDAKGEWFVVDELATSSNRPWITAYIVVEFLTRCALVSVDGTGHRLRAADGFTSTQAIAEFTVGEIKARERAEGR